MNKRWRLILDDKGHGCYNMAADEAIFLGYPRKRTPTLRIYGWRSPFITLGYNQNPADVLTGKENFPFVKRITGGAGILHYKEVTYSITCKVADLDLPANVKESFKVLSSFLIHFYSRLELNAQFAEDVPAYPLGSYGNFCFSSCQHFDLVINNKKLGGNAQRRKKELIFQQGSIPQGIDFELIKKTVKDVGDLKAVTFLNELLHKKTDFSSLRRLLANSFERVFNVEFMEEGLSDEEIKILNNLMNTKYLVGNGRDRSLPQDIFKEFNLSI